jgi:site-specific DNA-cytosine methylase
LLCNVLKVSEPFVGIGGMQELMAQCHCRYTSVNTYDIEPKYHDFHSRWGSTSGGDLASIGVFGPKGDVLQIDIHDLLDSSGLVAGCPCQPWAANGLHHGRADERSELSDLMVAWIVELSYRGLLLFVCLENSVRARHHMQIQQKFLEVTVPFFEFDMMTVQLSATLPHRRERLWLRGMRVDTLLGKPMPPPLWDLPKVKLVDLLQPDLENVDPTMLSTQKKRLSFWNYVKQIESHLSSGQAERGATAVMELDRAYTSVFGIVLIFDMIPAIRVRGPDYFLLSTEDLHLPWYRKRICRYLAENERFALQGHPVEAFNAMSGKTIARKATGNAYAVPMLAQVLLPMLNQIALSAVDIEKALSLEALDTLVSRKMLLSRESL